MENVFNYSSVNNSSVFLNNAHNQQTKVTTIITTNITNNNGGGVIKQDVLVINIRQGKPVFCDSLGKDISRHPGLATTKKCRPNC